MDPGHTKAVFARQTATELEIIPCATYADACRIEVELVNLHKPRLNGMCRAPKIPREPLEHVPRKIQLARNNQRAISASAAINPINWDTDDWIDRFIHWGQ